MIDESLSNEINAVYNIDGSRDLEEDINDAVEIANKFDGPKIDTHFICGSLFGLVSCEKKEKKSNTTHTFFQFFTSGHFKWEHGGAW